MLTGLVHRTFLLVGTAGHARFGRTEPALALGEVTGLGARARPLAVLRAYLATRRGRISYGELSRRLDVGQVASTAISYMGFAVKQER